MTFLKRFTFAAFGMAVLGSAFAQESTPIELHNLSEGHPTSLEDAFPVPEGARAFQINLAFASFDDTDFWSVEPGFLWGLTRDWQASVSIPFFFSDDDNETGDLRLGVLWGPKPLNSTDIAFAIGGELDIPTNSDDNEDDDDVDSRIKLLVTMPLDDNKGEANSRLHFNATFINSKNDSEGNVFALGYSQLIDPMTVFVTDFVRLDPEVGDTSDALEFGVRRAMKTGHGSLALRLGLNDNALDWGLSLGWQARL
jgi:hypothetical protein